ncbi:hypothetical protein AXO1947_17625 [Xanthomonas oryzae pv. oryzae]|nr:hypothetical protein AXO1947_17625 [Xanthomonas oryzae pv. oryzae]
MLETVNAHLVGRGLMMRQGTMVDATILNAPSSTKNKQGERDTEMHQTKKGNQYYFGMKAHIGTDRDSGLVHTVGGDGGERGRCDGDGAVAARAGEPSVCRHRLYGCEQA